MIDCLSMSRLIELIAFKIHEIMLEVGLKSDSKHNYWLAEQFVDEKFEFLDDDDVLYNWVMEMEAGKEV